MINLAQSISASPTVQTVPRDPGLSWIKEAAVAVDAPPDSEIDPLPEAQWPEHSTRTGICGAVSPRVVCQPNGSYRLYYTQILPRRGFPAGANDYDNATTRILSAFSKDGLTWTPEPGVRLSAQQGGAGDFRVVSSEVVPFADDSGRLRMYYECCGGPQSIQNSIRSAVSEDGGLEWLPEPGARLGGSGRNYVAPRVVFLEDGRCRLYCCERGQGIISALSNDGLTFRQEPGLRIAQDQPSDKGVAFAPEIVHVDGAHYRMYYAGYSTANRADILSAVSDDGLFWHKEVEPIISPGRGRWDAAKCSEMCVFPLPGHEAPRYRMVYEACDGTAQDQRGVWRIASATTPP